MLGSSVALAAIDSGYGVQVYVRRETALEEAKAIGIQRVTTNLSAAVQDADLLILATPVGAMPALAEEIVNLPLKSGVLVTDIGSVKGMVHDRVAPIFYDRGIAFLGSHPMAGSEQTGISAAISDVLQGAMCLLTDEGFRGEEVMKTRLENFWRTLGCKTKWLTTAWEHDVAVAKISHIPHIIAAATAIAGLADDASLGAFAGGGFRDTSRVAGGNAEMWAEILVENKRGVEIALERVLESLQQLQSDLVNQNRDAVLKFLKHAQELRTDYKDTYLS